MLGRSAFFSLVIIPALSFAAPSMDPPSKQTLQFLQKHFNKEKKSPKHNSLSVLTDPKSLSPVSPLLYSHSWNYILRKAKKTYVESLRYHQQASFLKKKGKEFKKTAHKSLFLIRRALTLTEKALDLFYSQSHAKRPLGKYSAAMKDASSFQDLASSAYENIQLIESMSSQR